MLLSIRNPIPFILIISFNMCYSHWEFIRHSMQIFQSVHKITSNKTFEWNELQRNTALTISQIMQTIFEYSIRYLHSYCGFSYWILHSIEYWKFQYITSQWCYKMAWYQVTNVFFIVFDQVEKNLRTHKIDSFCVSELKWNLIASHFTNLKNCKKYFPIVSQIITKKRENWKLFEKTKKRQMNSQISFAVFFCTFLLSKFHC